MVIPIPLPIPEAFTLYRACSKETLWYYLFLLKGGIHITPWYNDQTPGEAYYYASSFYYTRITLLNTLSPTHLTIEMSYRAKHLYSKYNTLRPFVAYFVLVTSTAIQTTSFHTSVAPSDNFYSRSSTADLLIQNYISWLANFYTAKYYLTPIGT